MCDVESSYFTYICPSRTICQSQGPRHSAMDKACLGSPSRRVHMEVIAMVIETRAMGFALTDAIRRHVESRVESALAPIADWVLDVTARVEDVNADRGGIDKR